jgi:hypothetical protein
MSEYKVRDADGTEGETGMGGDGRPGLMSHSEQGGVGTASRG